MVNRSSCLIACMVLLSLVSVSPIQATLIGDTFDTTGSIHTESGIEIVESTAEVNLLESWTINVEASSIEIIRTAGAEEFGDGSNQAFAGLEWVDMPTGKITGFTLTTNVPDLIDSDIAFTDNNLTIDLGNTNWDANKGENTAVIQLQTSHTVSIPSTLIFFGLGFAGFVAWRYRAEKTETY